MTDEIKNRIEQVKNGRVPEGYTSTWLGIRPSDWRLHKIGTAIKSTPRPVKMNDNDKYQLITVRRAYGGIVSRGIYRGKEILVKSQYHIVLGDFIISKRQIVHGACGVVRQESDNAIVSNEYNVFTMNAGYNLEYFNFSVQLPKAKHLFYLMSIGVHIEKMLFGTAEWLRQKIAFPSTAEQETIAKIITQCNKVIELKKQLIAEECNQKKWLMQNLLNPDSGVRLEGFEGEWKNFKLSKIGSTYGGLMGKSAEDFGEGKPYIPYLNIFSNYIIKDDGYDYVAIYEGDKQNKVKYGDVLFTTSSETPDEVGMSAVYLGNEKELYLNSFSFGYRLTNFNDLLPEFAACFFSCQRIKKLMYNLAQGATRYNLSKTELMKQNILIPPTIDEQTAIANIISNADRKIELLEQELEQWQKKKHSLMQLLLTGIVRVKV